MAQRMKNYSKCLLLKSSLSREKINCFKIQYPACYNGMHMEKKLQNSIR